MIPKQKSILYKKFFDSSIIYPPPTKDSVIMYMFIVKLRVLKGNAYCEGLGQKVWHLIPLCLVKYFLPEEELICVLDGFVNGWMYMCFTIWCVYIDKRGESKAREEGTNINYHSHWKATSYFSKLDFKILICILVRNSLCTSLKPFY